MRDWTEEELDAMAHAWSNMCNNDDDEKDDDDDDYCDTKYDQGYRDGFCDGHKRGRRGNRSEEEDDEHDKEKVYTTDDILDVGKVLLLPFAAVGIFGCELGKAVFNEAKSLYRGIKYRYNPWDQ